MFGPSTSSCTCLCTQELEFYTQAITAEWTFSRRREIYVRWQHDSKTWQHLERTIGDQFTALTQQPADNMEAMHHDLNHAVPALPGQRSKIQAHGSVTLFQQFWTLTRQFKQLRLEHFVQAGRCCFKVWKLYQQRQKLRSQMKTHSALSRKNKIKSVMERAQKAADSKDQYEFFKHIRQLAPKSPFKRIILRDDDGRLLGPHESADALAEWLSDLYAGPTSTTDWTSMCWPFLPHQMKRAFMTFSRSKAVAPSFLPSIFWKEHAELASQMIEKNMQHWKQQGCS